MIRAQFRLSTDLLFMWYTLQTFCSAPRLLTCVSMSLLLAMSCTRSTRKQPKRSRNSCPEQPEPPMSRPSAAWEPTSAAKGSQSSSNWFKISSKDWHQGGHMRLGTKVVVRVGIIFFGSIRSGHQSWPKWAISREPTSPRSGMQKSRIYFSLYIFYRGSVKCGSVKGS